MTEKTLFDEFIERKFLDDDGESVVDGKSEQTLERMQGVINRLEVAMDDAGVEKVEEITRSDVEEMVAFLKTGRYAAKEATINSTHLEVLRRVINIGKGLDRFPSDRSPVQRARELNDYDSASDLEAQFPEITEKEVAQVLRDEIDRRPLRPQERAVFVVSLKTGMRAGEVLNLDLQDIHIGYPPLKNREEYAGIEYHEKIRNEPDTIYVSSGIRPEEEYRGEVRKRGNKRDRSTKIPIDDELKHALVRWLAARPETPNIPTDPLFVTKEKDGDRYVRLTGYKLAGMVEDVADHMGWNNIEPPEDEEIKEFDDITHKWFRHFFSTHMRDPFDGMGVLFTSYFRGDGKPGHVAENPETIGDLSIDPYTDADWLPTRKHYLSNIYKFGLPTL